MKILIGYDGSECAEAALDDPLAPEFLGKVIPPLGETIEEDRREEKEWVAKISERSVELLRAAAIKVTCVVKEGDPKRELCKAAEEWGADCIFVGSTGFSNRFERFILGSVSAAVAARAHCSVEVVRPSNRIP